MVDDGHDFDFLTPCTAALFYLNKQNNHCKEVPISRLSRHVLLCLCAGFTFYYCYLLLPWLEDFILALLRTNCKTHPSAYGCWRTKIWSRVAIRSAYRSLTMRHASHPRPVTWNTLVLCEPTSTSMLCQTDTHEAQECVPTSSQH